MRIPWSSEKLSLIDYLEPGWRNNPFTNPVCGLSERRWTRFLTDTVNRGQSLLTSRITVKVEGQRPVDCVIATKVGPDEKSYGEYSRLVISSSPNNLLDGVLLNPYNYDSTAVCLRTLYDQGQLLFWGSYKADEYIDNLARIGIRLTESSKATNVIYDLLLKANVTPGRNFKSNCQRYSVHMRDRKSRHPD